MYVTMMIPMDPIRKEDAKPYGVLVCVAMHVIEMHCKFKLDFHGRRRYAFGRVTALLMCFNLMSDKLGDLGNSHGAEDIAKVMA